MSNLFAGAPLPGRFDKVEKTDYSRGTIAFKAADLRDKEASRKFERAEDQRRVDLNKIATYDISSLGQMGSEMFKVDAEELAEKIKNGELNPTEARAAITKLSGDYNLYKSHGDSMKERSEYAKKLATDPATRESYNDTLPVGYELNFGLDDYGARKNMSMNALFVPGSAQKGSNGNWTVEDAATGKRVSISQVTGWNDPEHFYKVANERVDVGDLQTAAMSEQIQTRILKRGGAQGFVEENALIEYDTLTEDNNTAGQKLRLQILEDFQDESGKTQFFDAENADADQRAFQFGPNESAFSRIEGITDPTEKARLQQAWLRVWGPPGQPRTKNDDGSIDTKATQGSGWILLNDVRPRFVEYARTKLSSDALNDQVRRQKTRADMSKGEKEELSNLGDLVPSLLQDQIEVPLNDFEVILNNSATDSEGDVMESMFLTDEEGKNMSEEEAKKTIDLMLGAAKNRAQDDDNQELVNLFDKVEVDEVFTLNPLKDIISITDKVNGNKTSDLDLSKPSDREAAFRFLKNLIPSSAVVAPEGPRVEYSLTQFKTKNRTIRLEDPENPGTLLDVNPVDFAFWPDGTIAMKNVIRPSKEGKTGSTVGASVIPLIVIDPTTSTGASTIKQLNNALRNLYGEGVSVDLLSRGADEGLSTSASDSNSGGNAR